MVLLRILFPTLLLVLTSLICHAQSQVLVHPDCKVNVTNLTFEDPFNLTVRIKNGLQKSGYELIDFPTIPKAYKGMIYVDFKNELEGKKLYPDCVVEFKLKQSKENITSKNDKILFSQRAKRSFPRISRKGKRRCQLALNDVLLKLPKCESMNKQ